MGEKINGEIHENRTETRTGGKTSQSTSSTEARTRRARTTRTRGTRRTRTEAEKEKLLIMANLNEEKLNEQQEKYDKEMAERKKAGITQKEPVKLSVSSDGAIEEAKPKRARKRRTKKQSIDTEPIEKLLITTTGIIATRPDMGMWKMTKQEAHAIAEPLGQVLEKYDLAISVDCATIKLLNGWSNYFEDANTRIMIDML